MSALTTLAAQARRFDDDAWVALGNRGLLRRAAKDLHRVEVRLVLETDDAVVVSVGEQEVRLPVPGGPAAATCSCPSTSVCQHVVTAGLWLAMQDGEDDAPLHDELMAFDDAALVAHAGRGTVRAARQLLVDLDAEREEIGFGAVPGPTVTFPRPQLTVRYLGGGLDAMILDQRVGDPARLRVAAVLAWQQAHGDEPVPPIPAATGRGRQAHLGRPRLRDAVTALTGDLLRIGVSHVSAAEHERIVTTATWAQGVEYHRLARSLRHLADLALQHLERSSAADDHELLAATARCHALVHALESFAADGTEPAVLVGRSRGRFTVLRTLELVGLGGLSWQSESGYHGLTVPYWSPDRQRFLTWTDARPLAVPGFEPRARWERSGPWTGLTSPSAGSGRLLRLTNARLSEDDRLSGNDDTAASAEPLTADALLTMLPAGDRWRSLAGTDGDRSLMTGRQAQRWAVLRPVVFGQPWFDPVRQQLTWPVGDVDGAVMSLRLRWSARNAHAVTRIESTPPLPAGTAVVVRLDDPSGSTALPVSLIRPGSTGPAVDALHLAAGADDRDDPHRPDRFEVAAPDAASQVVPALEELRGWLFDTAQRGTAGTDRRRVHDDLAEHHRRLRDRGLLVFSQVDPSADDVAGQLLQSHYLVQQVSALL